MACNTENVEIRVVSEESSNHQQIYNNDLEIIEQNEEENRIDKNERLKSKIQHVQNRFNKFTNYLKRQNICDIHIIDEYQKISEEYSKNISDYIKFSEKQKNETMNSLNESLHKYKKLAKKYLNAKIIIENNRKNEEERKIKFKESVSQLSSTSASTTIPAYIKSKSILTNTKSMTNLNNSRESTATNDVVDAEEDKKIKLKNELNKYNLKALRNVIKIDQMHYVNAKAVTEEFSKFLRINNLKSKYFAETLFHVRTKRFQDILNRPPAWFHCKFETKLTYFLIEKFLLNKTYVMNCLKQMKESKSAVSVVYKHKYTENHQSDRQKNSTLYASSLQRDNVELSEQNLPISITGAIEELITYLNEHSIDYGLFAKEILNISLEKFNSIIENKSEWIHNITEMRSIALKINDFLSNNQLKAKLFQLNEKYKKQNFIASTPVLSFRNEENNCILNTKRVPKPRIDSFNDAITQYNKQINKRIYGSSNEELSDDDYGDDDDDNSDSDYESQHVNRKMNIKKQKTVSNQDVDLNQSTNSRSFRAIKRSTVASTEDILDQYPYDISNLDDIESIIEPAEITRQAKLLIEQNNIRKADFCSSITKSAQSTISDMLNKPKPWNSYSELAKERLKLIYMWVQDEDRLSKINFSQFSAKYMNQKYNYEYLCKRYESNPSPSKYEIECISNDLRLTVRYIKEWFRKRDSIERKKVMYDDHDYLYSYKFQKPPGRPRGSQLERFESKLSSLQLNELKCFFNENLVIENNQDDIKLKIEILSNQLNLSINTINNWLLLKSKERNKRSNFNESIIINEDNDDGFGNEIEDQDENIDSDHPDNTINEIDKTFGNETIQSDNDEGDNYGI